MNYLNTINQEVNKRLNEWQIDSKEARNLQSDIVTIINAIIWKENYNFWNL